MSGAEQYRQAVAKAALQKAQFLSSMSAAKDRVQPARLKQDVKDKLSDGFRSTRSSAVHKAKEQPIAVGATATALLIYLFRRPISALFKRTYVRITNGNPDKAETDDG